MFCINVPSTGLCMPLVVGTVYDTSCHYFDFNIWSFNVEVFKRSNQVTTLGVFSFNTVYHSTHTRGKLLAKVATFSLICRFFAQTLSEDRTLSVRITETNVWFFFFPLTPWWLKIKPAAAEAEAEVHTFLKVIDKVSVDAASSLSYPG